MSPTISPYLTTTTSRAVPCPLLPLPPCVSSSGFMAGTVFHWAAQGNSYCFSIWPTFDELSWVMSFNTCFPPAEENWRGSQWSQAVRSSESFQTAQYCVLSPWAPLICAGTFLSVFLHRCLVMVWWLVAKILPHRTPWGIQFFCSITSTHSSPSWGWTLSFCPLKKKTCSLLQGQMWKWPWGKIQSQESIF